MTKQRPDPETLLQRAREEEIQSQRGKLKIYLGAVPGVGKTYTMLQDAIAKRAQGLDVIVGVVESHGRQEIEALLKGFNILPKQKVMYHDKELLEFDLDGALQKNPGLILIDEMAHTNVPGLRYSKRWQDIKEVLDRGIDVYTTLNVQHIESLNDIVAQIIQINIKETVPDTMLELADTIELVDLPPEDLLRRLQDGKVYFPDQAAIAKENFFRKGNIIALRELALRFTAEYVGAQVILYREGEGIKRIWPTKAKILVCIGKGPECMKLIRTARHMANSLHAEWIAVYVDAPKLKVSEDDRNNAIRNLRYAEQLGAETRILIGLDVAKEIMNFAREQNITQIMVWRKIRSRFMERFFSNLADEIVRYSGSIDVHIVTPEIGYKEQQRPIYAQEEKKPIPWAIYGIAVVVVALASVINFLLAPFLVDCNLVMVYLLGITIVALFGQIGPSILASIASVLVYEFFFIPIRYSLVLLDLQYLLTLMVMLLVALTISHLTITTKKQIIIAKLAEHYTSILHNLNRQLAITRGIDKLLERAVSYIGDIFESEVSVLLPSEDGKLTIKANYRTAKELSEKEQSVVQWVYDLGQIAGLGTDTLSFSEALYLPLLTPEGTMGVLRARPTKPKYLFLPEQMHLLESCANQIAIALEVDRLEEQAQESELRIATDNARSSLLKFVSRNLNKPVSAIQKAAADLLEARDPIDSNKIQKLGEDINNEAQHLSRLISNLL